MASSCMTATRHQRACRRFSKAFKHCERRNNMKYAAIIEYLQDKAKIAEIRPVHRQYLASLKDKGQLAASGPFTDDSGALIVYEASTREDAESLLKGDPFNQ